MGGLNAIEAPLTPVEQRAPGHWQIGTVRAIKRETPHVKSFWITLPMWMPHLPGQHYEVRLTAPDGYSAQRSYSIASSPLDEGEIELTIDRLDGRRGLAVLPRRGAGRRPGRGAGVRSRPISCGAGSTPRCSWAAARASCR